jgi:hypothetical protein
VGKGEAVSLNERRVSLEPEEDMGMESLLRRLRRMTRVSPFLHFLAVVVFGGLSTGSKQTLRTFEEYLNACCERHSFQPTIRCCHHFGDHSKTIVTGPMALGIDAGHRDNRHGMSDDRIPTRDLERGSEGIVGRLECCG